jgi:hypothetical protein
MKKEKFKSLVLAGAAVLGMSSITAYAAAPSSAAGSSDHTGAHFGALLNLVPGQVYSPVQLGITVNVPPSGFDPLTASVTDLEKYGYPAKPTDPTALAHWEDLMSHAKNFIIPEFKVSNVSHAPKMSGTSYGLWQGYVASESSGSPYNSQPFTNVMGQWNLPTVTGSGAPANQWAYSANWVGFGSTNIVQAGTVSEAYGGSSSTSYQIWTEAYPLESTAVNVPNFTVSAGDNIYIDIGYNASTGTANFYIEDYTRNEVSSFPQSGLSGYQNNHVEWVSEDPIVSGGNPPYAKYGSTTITGCQATENSTQSSFVYYPLSIHNDPNQITGDQIATVGGIVSNTQFTDTWKNWN